MPEASYHQMQSQFLVNWLYIKPDTIDNPIPAPLPARPPPSAPQRQLFLKGFCLFFFFFQTTFLSCVISFRPKSSNIISMLMTPKSGLALISLLVTADYWETAFAYAHRVLKLSSVYIQWFSPLNLLLPLYPSSLVIISLSKPGKLHPSDMFPTFTPLINQPKVLSISLPKCFLNYAFSVFIALL